MINARGNRTLDMNVMNIKEGIENVLFSEKAIVRRIWLTINIEQSAKIKTTGPDEFKSSRNFRQFLLF